MDVRRGLWKQGSEWTCRYSGGSSKGSMTVNGGVLKLTEARDLGRGSREVGVGGPWLLTVVLGWMTVVYGWMKVVHGWMIVINGWMTVVYGWMTVILGWMTVVLGWQVYLVKPAQTHTAPLDATAQLRDYQEVTVTTRLHLGHGRSQRLHSDQICSPCQSVVLTAPQWLGEWIWRSVFQPVKIDVGYVVF